MFIVPTVVLYAHARYRALASRRGVVMAWPYSYMIRKTKKLSSGLEQGAGVSTGEVTARRSNIRVEDRVTAEYIIWTKSLAKSWQKEGAERIETDGTLTPDLVT